MGAPIGLSKAAQAATGLGHFSTALETLKNYKFEEVKGSALIRKEPIGVVGMITPWNWPINQISCKVGPALAAGCTMVLKPTEIAPFNAILLADVLHEAGVPKGVFNLVNGDGPSVGEAMSAHPKIDIIPYKDEDDAIRIANDTPYGLSGYVSSEDPEHALSVARRIRSGNVHINNKPTGIDAPFGGFKQSGNGREWGEFGFEEFLEIKAVMGYASK